MPHGILYCLHADDNNLIGGGTSHRKPNAWASYWEKTQLFLDQHYVKNNLVDFITLLNVIVTQPAIGWKEK